MIPAKVKIQLTYLTNNSYHIYGYMVKNQIGIPYAIE